MEGCTWRELHESLHSGSTRESVYIESTRVSTRVSLKLQECVTLYTRLKIRESLPVHSIRRRELVMMPEARSFVSRHRKGLHNTWSPFHKKYRV